MPAERYRRRTARVLLLDDADRILLFRIYLNHRKPERGCCWLTPGGGVEKGETLRAAAARELREETGLAVEPEDLGPTVAHTSGYANLGWAKGVFRDDFFLYRVGRHEVDTSGFAAAERSQITAHRWWPARELATTTEDVYPLGLARLLEELLDGRVPAQPVQLPWHH